MSVHEYSMKSTQLSCYAPEMVADMRTRMSLFVARLSHRSSKEGKAAMLIGDMDIARLMIHVQQVMEDKLKDREEFKNKRAKTSGNESGQQKSNVNRSSFQHKHKGPAPLSAQGTNISTIVRILRTSELDLRISKIELYLYELLQGQAKKETVFMLSVVAERKRIRQMLSLFRQLEIYAKVFEERTLEEKRGERAKFIVLEGLACGFRQGLIPRETQVTRISIQRLVDPVDHSESVGELPSFPEDPFTALNILFH
uniref:Retrotransposon gag protein n=1 Tax=Solanum tuberosum TaxID=4113 RepID=M1DQF4_SOLTU